MLGNTPADALHEGLLIMSALMMLLSAARGRPFLRVMRDQDARSALIGFRWFVLAQLSLTHLPLIWILIRMGAVPLRIILAYALLDLVLYTTALLLRGSGEER